MSRRNRSITMTRQGRYRRVEPCPLCGLRHPADEPVDLVTDNLGNVVNCYGPFWAAEAWRRGWYQREDGRLELGPSGA